MEEPSTPSLPPSSAAVTPSAIQPRANGVQRHDLGDAEKHLWALGLDAREEKPPLSYTTPGASLARLRLDLAEQYHRVCSSLGAHEGSFPPVDAGGRLLWPLPSDQLNPAGQDLASIAGPHMMLRPSPFLGAPSPLLYELDQPLAALQAIGHQPQLGDAVSNMWRHANGGPLLGAGRRRGSRLRPLPQNPSLFLTQGEGVGSPQLDEPQQGSILQEESSLVFPRSHKHSPAIIHKAPPSSALSPGTQMPSIDTLSDFVYTRHDRRKEPLPVQAGLQQTARDSQDFCNQCSCALFSTFKPELRASGMFDVEDADRSQEAIAAAVTEGAAMITQCVEDFLPQFLASGVQIDSLAGLAECEFRDGEAPQCLIDRVRDEFPEVSEDVADSSNPAEGTGSSRGSTSSPPSSPETGDDSGSNFEPDTREDVEDDDGASGSGSASSPPPSSPAPPSGDKGEDSSSSKGGSSSGSGKGSTPPSPSPSPDSSSGSSSADADDAAPPSSGAAVSVASGALLVLCTAAAAVVLGQL